MSNKSIKNNNYLILIIILCISKILFGAVDDSSIKTISEQISDNLNRAISLLKEVKIQLKENINIQYTVSAIKNSQKEVEKYKRILDWTETENKEKKYCELVQLTEETAKKVLEYSKTIEDLIKSVLDEKKKIASGFIPTGIASGSITKEDFIAELIKPVQEAIDSTMVKAELIKNQVRLAAIFITKSTEFQSAEEVAGSTSWTKLAKTDSPEWNTWMAAEQAKVAAQAAEQAAAEKALADNKTAALAKLQQWSPAHIIMSSLQEAAEKEYQEWIEKTAAQKKISKNKVEEELKEEHKKIKQKIKTDEAQKKAQLEKLLFEENKLLAEQKNYRYQVMKKKLLLLFGGVFGSTFLSIFSTKKTYRRLIKNAKRYSIIRKILGGITSTICVGFPIFTLGLVTTIRKVNDIK